METNQYEDADGILAIMGTGMLVFILIISFILIVASWKIFVKAGKPGWASIIPIYSGIVLLEIVGKPTWWIILLMIPFVNIVFAIVVCHRLSLAFGYGIGMTFLMIIIPFIGFPVLGFGSAQYVGPPRTPQPAL